MLKIVVGCLVLLASPQMVRADDSSAIALLQRKVTDLETQLATVETYIHSLQNACSMPGNNLPSSPVGFKCFSREAIPWVVVARDGFGEAWKDNFGVIWSGVFGPSTLEDAKKNCEKLHASLPTIAEFLKAADAGLGEVVAGGDIQIMMSNPCNTPYDPSSWITVGVARSQSCVPPKMDALANNRPYLYLYRCIAH